MIIEYGSNAEDTYFKVSMSIVGFFVLRKEEIEIKNNLDIDMFLKTQPLAILSPYLMASLTSFLISAGVTQFVFPLINMKKLAEQHLADKKIIEVLFYPGALRSHNSLCREIHTKTNRNLKYEENKNVNGVDNLLKIE